MLELVWLRTGQDAAGGHRQASTAPVNAALSDPAIRKKLVDSGARIPVGGRLKRFGTFMKAEYGKKWGAAVVRERGASKSENALPAPDLVLPPRYNSTRSECGRAAAGRFLRC